MTPEELVITGQFMRQQLQATNRPLDTVKNTNISNLAVGLEGFHSASYLSYMAIPRGLFPVIAELDNKEKLNSDHAFEEWYDNKCTKDPIYQILYEPAIDAFKKKDHTMQEKQARIRQLDQENYHTAQGLFDHEVTHIIKKHDPHNTKRNIAIGVALIAVPLTLSLLFNNTGKPNPIRNSIVDIAKISCASYVTHRLLNKKRSRNKEREADAGVRDDVNILRAQANFYERSDKTSLKYDDLLFHIMDPVFYCLYATHPRDKERQQYFSKRADALEQQLSRNHENRTGRSD